MTDTLALEGRVAIVTGGARGIGAAISEKLVAEGAKVIVADSGVDISGNDPDPSTPTVGNPTYSVGTKPSPSWS